MSRYAHSACLVENNVLIFGGLVGQSQVPCNELMKVSLTSPTETTIVTPSHTSDVPPATFYHSSVVYNGKMYVFGGKGNPSVFVYSLQRNEWSVMKTNKKDHDLYGHCSVVYNGSMIVYGGSDKYNVTSSEMRSLNLKTGKWKAVKLSGCKLQPRMHHTMNIIDHTLIIYGGTNASNSVALNELLLVDLKLNTVHSVTINFDHLLNSELGRFGHASVANKRDERHIVVSVFGGIGRTDLCDHNIDYTIEMNENSAIASNSKQRDNSTSELQTCYWTATSHANGILFYGGRWVSPKAKIEILPDEIIHIIFEYLDWYTLRELSLVSRSFVLGRVSKDDRYWKEKYERLVSRIEFASILNDIQVNDTPFRSVISIVLAQFWSVLDSLQSAQAIRHYFKTDTNRVEVGGYNYTYLGTYAINYLFSNISDQSSLKNKFGTNRIRTVTKENGIKVEMTDLKVVITGDGAVGKTCLLYIASGHQVTCEAYPTIIDSHHQNIDFGRDTYHIEYCDTACQDEYDHLRPLVYPGVDLLLICFSMINPESFERVAQKWIVEARHHAPDAAIVLVGTKKDLVSETNLYTKTNLNPVTYEMGQKLAAQLGCLAYIETSSVTTEGASSLSTLLMQTLFIHRAANGLKQEDLRKRRQSCLLS